MTPVAVSPNPKQADLSQDGSNDAAAEKATGRASPTLQSDASSLPNPWIAPATLPRRNELQIIAFIQVTTVVSRSFSKLS